ncbi:MAG: DUF2971 domain-containing protein [Pseudomonadota bacterium]
MNILMKYTNLAAALHTLSARHLTLLDPGRWDDRNDAHLMRRYREASGAPAVLATCFTQTADTYHHWRVFAGGSDGVRLEIDKDKLLASLRDVDGIVTGEVRYLQVQEFRQGAFTINDLPFIKRHPYADERESRILRHLDSRATEAVLPIKLAWVKRVTISPWMAPALAKTVKTSLRAIDGCARLKAYQSTLINNRDWRSAADRLTAPPPAGRPGPTANGQ